MYAGKHALYKLTSLMPTMQNHDKLFPLLFLHSELIICGNKRYYFIRAISVFTLSSTWGELQFFRSQFKCRSLWETFPTPQIKLFPPFHSLSHLGVSLLSEHSSWSVIKYLWVHLYPVKLYLHEARTLVCLLTSVCPACIYTWHILGAP